MPDQPLRPARPPRAVLFDVDGTLVDTVDLHGAAWVETFRRFGREVPFETVRPQIGKGGDNLVPALLPDATDELREEMEAVRGPLFKRDFLPRAVPFPGVRALFERLAEGGVAIVLASSSDEEDVRFHLDLIACADLVDATTSRDDADRSKPCPDIFAAALAKVAPLAAQDAVVVGDSPWDIEAAAKLALPAIGFRSGGFPEDELIEAGAFALYDGPSDLLARYDSSIFARAHAEA
jgi:HAD superfamily hydrolase (TIGR01509 family)